MAAVVSSSSPFSASSSSCLLSSGFSRTPWFHGVSVKIPFPNRKLVKTLVFVGSGSGLRTASRSQAALSDGHDAWASDSCPRSEIEFLTLCRRLKTTKRMGWVHRRIEDPESIADHMYRVALMGLILKDIPGVNRERCIKMAIVHDIAEAIVGNITPSNGVPKAEKSRREKAALKKMCNILGGGERAKEIKELWEEYENNSSPEAKLVKDFNKIELILQALEYEMSEYGRVLNDIYLYTSGKFQTEIGRKWAAEIHGRRNSLLRGRVN